MLHHIHYLLALALALGACEATTSLEQSWTASALHNQPSPTLTHVVTVYVSDSATLRRAGEDQLALDLAKKGVAAVPSYTFLTDADARELEHINKQPPGVVDELTSRLRRLGYDGVVTMRIVDSQEHVHYTPPTYYYGGWGYPWGWSDGIYWPAYTDTYTTFHTETNAYSLRTGALVWSGLIKSVAPESAPQMLHETSQIVAEHLTKSRLAG